MTTIILPPEVEAPLAEEARKTAYFVISNQNNDGSWYYGKRSTTEWIDNYHTGYILECLDTYAKIFKDPIADKAVAK